ncbi:hypothetical protein MASR2M15_27590 [Anaerolineales bacterium]
MTIVWAKILPVLVSIVVIIGIAIVSTASTATAALFATIPTKIPISLWIVASTGGNEDPEVLASYMGSVFFGLLSALTFRAVAYLCLRSGIKLMPSMIISYIAYFVVFGIISWLR